MMEEKQAEIDNAHYNLRDKEGRVIRWVKKRAIRRDVKEKKNCFSQKQKK